ncbi:MAG: hypothetical protein HY720_22470 [Planctomycetes bacterium]|nr:hypothetical protein [Planctomycetota bacterium]
MRTLAALLAAILASASLGPRSAGQEAYDAGLLWNGLSYEWEGHPHRLSVLGSRYEVGSVDPWTGALEGSHEFSVRIGSFPPDRASYESRYEAVRSRAVEFGQIRVGPIELEGRIGAELRREVEFETTLAAMGIRRSPRRPRAVALLAGLSVRSTGWESGWHFQGLGVGVSRARIHEDGSVTLAARAFVRPADSPDFVNGFDYLGDWPAGEPVGYRVWLDVTVVVGEAEDFVATAIRIRNGPTRLATRTRILRDVRLTGRSTWDGNRAFLGTASFELALDADTRRDGRYIRRLEVAARDFVYDPATRRARFAVAHGFSNQGLISYPWRLISESVHVLVEVRDPALQRGEGRIRGKVEGGAGERVEVRSGS